MITLELFIAFSVFAFVSSITPGPNNIMLMASGTNFGFKKTIPHLLGVNLGFGFLLFCVGIGLMQIFDLFPIMHDVFKIFCSIYLIYLAYRIATSASQTKNSQSRARPFSFIQAILFQWINPKGWSMALTGISVYSTSSSLVGVLIITLAYTMINLPCICFWTMLGEQFGRFMTSNLRLRIFNYIMATLLVLTLVQIFFMG